MTRSSLGYHPGDRPIPGQGYELLALLGVGQFGEVWKATAPGGFEIALKLIDLTRQEGEREFAALSQLRHIRNPHLIPITASWILDEDGQLLDESCLIDPLHRGVGGGFGRFAEEDALAGRRLPAQLIVGMGLGEKCLSTRLKECKAAGLPGIPLTELLEYIEGAAKGLDYLHSPIHEMGQGPAPIIHRDVKPHNILVVGREAQVCDFGLARAMPNLLASRTQTAVGTLAYMAPEVARYRPATAQSDQYSLAITYFELRTGKLPFGDCNAPNLVDVVHAHESGRLRLHPLRPAERRVVAKAADKTPTRRYATCSEFVAALRLAIEEERSRPKWFAKLARLLGRRSEPPADRRADEPPHAPGAAASPLTTTRAFNGSPPERRPEAEPGGPPPSGAARSGQSSDVALVASEATRKPMESGPALEQASGSDCDRLAKPVPFDETLPHHYKLPAPSPEDRHRQDGDAPGAGASGGPIGAEVTATGALPGAAVPADDAPQAGRQTHGRAQRRRVSIGAGVAAVVLTGLVLAVVGRDRLSERYRTAAWRTADPTRPPAPARVNDEERKADREAAKEFEAQPPADPHADKQVLHLVGRHEFERAVQLVSEAPPEERRALRDTIRNAWWASMKEEWDRGQIKNVSTQCDRYLACFPVEEEPSTALVWLLLADCQMRLRPAGWEEKVSAILHTVRTFEDGEGGFLRRAKAEWKTDLIQLRFDILVRRPSTLGERVRLLAEYDGVKEKYLAEEAATDIIHAGVDPPELDSHRHQIVVQVGRSIDAAWEQLSEGRLEEARKMFAVVEPIVQESDEVSGRESLRAVFALHDRDTPADSVCTAIDVLDGHLAAGCEDRHRIVIAAALARVAEREDGPLLERHLGRAIRLIRAERLHDAAVALSELWERCVRAWLRRGSLPLEEELTKLEEDAAWLRQTSRRSPLLDLAAAYWRGEDDSETVRALQVPVGDLPDELALFFDYLRLRALFTRTEPDFDAVVEQATVLLTTQQAAPALHLHGRLAKAASAAVRACAQQQQEELRTRFPSYPYLELSTAERHVQLLGAAERLPPETLAENDRRALEKGLALALASKEQPDWARVWAMSHRASSGLSGEGLPVDEVALCDACVRSYLRLPPENQRDPRAGHAALKAAIGLLEGVAERGGPAEATPVALYRELLEPLQQNLRPFLELAKTAQSPEGAAADLERYYAALGELIELYRFAPFTQQAADHEEANAKLRERFFHWAIYLHSKNPERNHRIVAGYYVQRGHARAQLAEPDLTGALQDAKDALRLQPDLQRAHGLTAHALLVRSREQLTLKERRDDLDAAIDAGLKARESTSEFDGHTKAVLWLNLSYAHLERANFVRDLSFQRQKDDLLKALHFARKAAAIPQRYPEYPLLAKGHAYEDLAWIAEEQSEENYRKAVAAFREADRHMILGLTPKLATARSLYKAVCHTQLHPRQLGPFNSNEDVYAEAENLLNRCIEAGNRSGTVDPAVLLYLGNIAEVQGQFQAADEYFGTAWRHASEQALPSRATFAVRWANFPFSHAQWEPEERQAEALRRAAALAGVPVAPGGKPDPAKEAALILAQVDQMRGDRTSALARLDAALPETVDDAEWPDLGLLLLRADLRASAALEPESPAWNVAKAALDDVERAFVVAVTRFDLVGACQQAFLVYHHVHAAVDRHRTAPSELPDRAQLSTRAQDHLETWHGLVRRSEGLSDACETMALMAGKEAERARPPARAPDRLGGLEEELRLWQAADVWMKRAANLTDDDAKRRRRGEHGTTLAEIIKRVREELDQVRKQQAPTP